MAVDREDLRDFVTHPAWRLLDAKFKAMREQALMKAAREKDEHERKLGQLEGVEMVMRALETWKREGERDAG